MTLFCQTIGIGLGLVVGLVCRNSVCWNLEQRGVPSLHNKLHKNTDIINKEKNQIQESLKV